MKGYENNFNDMADVLINNRIGNEVTETLNFVLEQCCNCGIPFFMTKQLNKQCRNDVDKYFYCPNGHPQHYCKSTDEKKIEQLERDLQIVKNDRQQIENNLLDTISEKNKLSRQLKRVHKGVCPCCNRSFVNLANHMKTKHPDVK